VTDAGLKEFATGFPALHSLSLTDTGTTAVGVAELRRVRPQLHVSR
jgi:hypothetical protein